MSDFGFYLFIAVMIIFTAGEPDLLDAITYHYMPEQCITTTEEE